MICFVTELQKRKSFLSFRRNVAHQSTGFQGTLFEYKINKNSISIEYG
jgi:hypothetical protein